MLNTRHPPRAQAVQSSASNKKFLKENYEGFEANKTNLIEVHIESKTNENLTFTLKGYKGKWKSELNYMILLEIPTIKNLTNTWVWNISDSQVRASTKIIRHKSILGMALQNNSKELTGHIWIDESFSLRFVLHNVDTVHVYNSRLMYGLFISLVYLFNLVVLIRHYKVCMENLTFASQTSTFSLGILLLYELTFALWQLSKAFSDRVTDGIDYLLIASFWGFIIFMLIYGRILIRVFEAGNQSLSEVNIFMRNRLISNFQSRVFLLIIFGIVLIRVFYKYYFFTVCLLHSFFIPQIVLNSFYGYKKSFSMVTVTVLLLSKLMVAVYFLCFEDSVVRYKRDLKLMAVVSGLILIQGAVLYWQRFHPRFLVPRKYQPLHYDYFRPKSEEERTSDSENVCNICITRLNIGKHADIVNFSKTMHTPCSHRYHQNCLTQWMEIKLECPTCRSKLPQVEDY
jgi:hypothetical protein